MLLRITHVYWRGPGLYALIEKTPTKRELFLVDKEVAERRDYENVGYLQSRPEGKGMIFHREATLMGFG